MTSMEGRWSTSRMSPGIVIPDDPPRDEGRTSSRGSTTSMLGGAPFHAWQIDLRYDEVRAPPYARST
jgi:hypothetical protein